MSTSNLSAVKSGLLSIEIEKKTLLIKKYSFKFNNTLIDMQHKA